MIITQDNADENKFFATDTHHSQLIGKVKPFPYFFFKHSQTLLPLILQSLSTPNSLSGYVAFKCD